MINNDWQMSYTECVQKADESKDHKHCHSQQLSCRWHSSPVEAFNWISGYQINAIRNIAYTPVGLFLISKLALSIFRFAQISCYKVCAAVDYSTIQAESCKWIISRPTHSSAHMYLCLRALFPCIRLGLHAYAYRDHDVQQALLQEHQIKTGLPFFFNQQNYVE